ncbi:MAG TPA: glutamine synthetase family protein [Actinomycetota bacterium]|nr:glutamine synthetase family protein [Actinomycetota bacterium]
MTAEEILDACRTQAVRLVRFLYCDNGGVIRGKATHVERLGDRVRTGIGLTVAMQAMNSLDQLQPVEGMGPVGEIRLVPDLDTFTVLPYAPHTAAMLADHLRLDGQPYEAGPRNFLKRMAARLAERGMVLSCAVENEWSLATQRDGRHVPVDESLCFSTVGMAASAEVTDATVAALGEQGIQVEQYYAELGHGQQELSVAPRPAVQAADTQVLVRETIRGVAAQFGLVASLAPKPWPDQAGNGAHIHFSLWDAEGRRNLFHDPTGRFGLSKTAEQFLAGVLTHVHGLLALTAPSVNSYHRLLPQHWSSAFVCWGSDNREATVRVPSTFWGMEQASTNLEFKPTDASCNPYLAFGGLIAAGLDGIERELEAPEPLSVDPATLPDREREAAGAHRYPTTLQGSIEHLERDEVLVEALGELLARSYLAVRRSEWEAYAAMPEDERFRAHFLKY